MSSNRHIAETILSQLGGRRFTSMTGAKNFVALTTGGLQFDIPKIFDKPAFRMQIRLNSSDLYDLTFFKGKGVNIKKTKEINDVYAEDLCDIFEVETGLLTSL